MSLKSPLQHEDLSSEENKLVRKIITDPNQNFYKYGPKKFVLSAYYLTYKDEIYNFPIRSSDTWVVTLPRSGTTLTQEMVWQISNNLDIDGAGKEYLVKRYTFFEYAAIANKLQELLEYNKNNPKMLKDIQEIFTNAWDRNWPVDKKRFMKTHLPISLLPRDLLTSGCKIIYVARSPKDMMVSRYFRQFKEGEVDFETFWELFEKNLYQCFPYWEHIQEGWELRHNKNVLFLYYEDIVKSPKEAIMKTANFLEKQLSEAQIDKLVDHLKFENFRKNEAMEVTSLEREKSDLPRKNYSAKNSPNELMIISEKCQKNTNLDFLVINGIVIVFKILIFGILIVLNISHLRENNDVITKK